MSSESAASFAVLILSVIIVSCYHIFMAYQVRHNPVVTFLGSSLQLKQQFVAQLLASKKPIEGVQIFRNSILIATVYVSISLAILFMVPVLFVSKHAANLFGRWIFSPPLACLPCDLSRCWNSHAHDAAMLTINFIIMLMNSVQSCRFLLHATFAVIGMELHEAPTLVEMLYRSHLHFSISQRCIFNVFPLGLCIFGVSWGLLGSIIAVLLLYYLDHPYPFNTLRRTSPELLQDVE